MAAGKCRYKLLALTLDGASMTDAQKKLVKYDPDLLSDTDGTSIYVVDGLTSRRD